MVAIIGFDWSQMTQIDIEKIAGGFHGLTPIAGSYLLESYMVTMKLSKHKSGVVLSVPGKKKVKFELVWKKKVTKQMERSYRDQGIATEHAAECLGILVAKELTGFEVIERSVKKTGFDYWLGEKKRSVFQNMAKLECAGRFDVTGAPLRAVYKDKIEQMRQSKHLPIPGYAAVTGFADPILHFGKR